MDLTGATALLASWWWVIALVVVFAAIYRFGTGRSGGSAGPAGYGCLVAVVITVVFFLVVIF
jgi:hypothetical protein